MLSVCVRVPSLRFEVTSLISCHFLIAPVGSQLQVALLAHSIAAALDAMRQTLLTLHLLAPVGMACD